MVKEISMKINLKEQNLNQPIKKIIGSQAYSFGGQLSISLAGLVPEKKTWKEIVTIYS